MVIRLYLFIIRLPGSSLSSLSVVELVIGGDNEAAQGKLVDSSS